MNRLFLSFFLFAAFAFAQCPPGYTLTSGVCVQNGGTTAAAAAGGSLSGNYPNPTLNGGATVDSSGNILTPGGIGTGNGSNQSGFYVYNGATTGASGFGAPTNAGTPVVYLMPAAPPSLSTQVLGDTGVATCPALPATAPTLCHQMSWVTATGAAGALTQIQQIVISSSTASITFASIPSTFSSLLLKWKVRTSSGGTTTEDLKVQFNGDTGNHYVTTVTYGNGSAGAGSSSLGVAGYGDWGGLVQNGNPIGNATIGRMDIEGYTDNLFKSFSGNNEYMQGGSTANPGYAHLDSQWESVAVINSITLSCTASTFLQGTFTLYGIQ